MPSSASVAVVKARQRSYVTVCLFVGADSVVVEISESDQQSSDGTQTWPMRGHRRKPSRGPELPVLDQLPVSVLCDMRYGTVHESAADNLDTCD